MTVWGPSRPGVRVWQSKLIEGADQPIDFLQGVVMHQADAQKSALTFEAQSFRQAKRVHVPVPHVDMLLSQMLGDFAGTAAGRRNGNGRHARPQATYIGDSPNLEARALDQGAQQ